MKKTLLVLLTISASFLFQTTQAQWCGTVSNCTGNPLQPTGFEAPDSIPCAVQGVAYNDKVSFQMYANFNYLGQHQIDSLTFDTLYNLPCGLCWSLNKASKTYFPGEFGCFSITGTTTDPVGQYNLRLVLTAYLAGGGGQGETVYPATVDAAGIKEWFRVAAPGGGTCAAVDTSVNGFDQVASTTCHGVSINEVIANVSAIDIMPNPMNSSAILSFIAGKPVNYVLHITDITGKIISTKEISAVAGVNTTTIEKGNLSGGIYLISLSNGVTSVTRKFIIAE